MHTNSGKKVFHAIMRCHCVSEHSSHSSLSKAVLFHECGTLRHAQAPSGALRYSLKRSTSILAQPSTSVSSATTVAIATTASRATDTLYCFNGLHQPKGPVGPKRPKSPKGPKDGCLPSISVSQSPNFP